MSICRVLGSRGNANARSLILGLSLSLRANGCIRITGGARSFNFFKEPARVQPPLARINKASATSCLRPRGTAK